MVPPTPLASLSLLADRFATIINHRQGPLLTPGPTILGLILFWSLLNSYILTTAEWIQHVVTMDRQFRALICLSCLRLKLVGRFLILYIDNGRINITLYDERFTTVRHLLRAPRSNPGGDKDLQLCPTGSGCKSEIRF